jgi:hypothetical protein
VCVCVFSRIEFKTSLVMKLLLKFELILVRFQADETFDEMTSFEHRTLNYLINEYLLTNNYKLTSVTFTEENQTFDFDHWKNQTKHYLMSVDLIHLYRWYCYQSERHIHQTTSVDFSMQINLDEQLTNEKCQSKCQVEQTVNFALQMIAIRLDGFLLVSNRIYSN